QRMVRERAYFKRSAQLVRKAKEQYGTVCQACRFDFGKRYGELGEGYIECHHLNPLSENVGAEWSIGTRLEEVTVLCSNCHRMIHRRRPALTLDEVRDYLR